MGDPVDKIMGSASNAVDSAVTPVSNAVTKTGEIDQVMDSDIVQKGFPVAVMTILGQGAVGATGSGEAGFAGEAGGTTGGAGPAATTPGTAASASAGSSVPVPQAQAASVGSASAPPTETLGGTGSGGGDGGLFNADAMDKSLATGEAPPQPNIKLPGGIPAYGGVPMLDTLKTAATVLTPVMSIFNAAAGIKASKQAKATAGKPVDGTPPPVVTPPVAMPTATGGSSVLSKPIVERTATQDMVRRRGRASTILTDSSDRLGN